MSASSKEQNLTAAPPAQPRQPKCARCRNHGILVPQKGHMRHCPFVSCSCWKCCLITQRTKIMALQRNLRRSAIGGQPCLDARAGGMRPEGSRRLCTLTPDASPAEDDGPPQSATPARMYPQSGAGAGADRESYSEPRCVTTQHTPRAAGPSGHPHLQISPAAGGEHVAGVDDRQDRPVESREHWSRYPVGPPGIRDPPYFTELGPNKVYSSGVLAVPAMELPFRGFPPYPSSSAPHQAMLVNMPAIPPRLYKDGPPGSLVFPHIQWGAAHYTSPPELGPPVDCRGLFLTPLSPVAGALSGRAEDEAAASVALGQGAQSRYLRDADGKSPGNSHP
ncbi:doublesex and mab-3 related transcription factor 3, truncated-like [Myripristis murdjan]|uniref:doublesex and mab-3 related transcription factor 3, truncated-like n=1 Tax=Myripristis murdjan TaxID=586833 RepID=UPI001175FC23|nr:doublesex and mab-3 related transcription factor 3, truncated-like [Myripristis murdjan]